MANNITFTVSTSSENYDAFAGFNFLSNQLAPDNSTNQWYYAIFMPTGSNNDSQPNEVYNATITINTSGVYYFFLTGAGGYGGASSSTGGNGGGGAAGQGLGYNPGLILDAGSTIMIALPFSNDVSVNDIYINAQVVVNGIQRINGTLHYYTATFWAAPGTDGAENSGVNGGNGGNGGWGGYYSATETGNNTFTIAEPEFVGGGPGNGGNYGNASSSTGATNGKAGSTNSSYTGSSDITGASTPNCAMFTFADGTTTTYELLQPGQISNNNFLSGAIQNTGAGLASFMIYYNALA
jgi:hypothetical protein